MNLALMDLGGPDPLGPKCKDKGRGVTLMDMSYGSGDTDLALIDPALGTRS